MIMIRLIALLTMMNHDNHINTDTSHRHKHTHVITTTTTTTTTNTWSPELK